MEHPATRRVDMGGRWSTEAQGLIALPGVGSGQAAEEVGGALSLRPGKEHQSVDGGGHPRPGDTVCDRHLLTSSCLGSRLPVPSRGSVPPTTAREPSTKVW